MEGRFFPLPPATLIKANERKDGTKRQIAPNLLPSISHLCACKFSLRSSRMRVTCVTQRPGWMNEPKTKMPI